MSALCRTLARTVVRAKERDHSFHQKISRLVHECCCVENSFDCHSPFKNKILKIFLPLCGKWDGWPPLSAALRADNGWPHAVCTGINTGLFGSDSELAPIDNSEK